MATLNIDHDDFYRLRVDVYKTNQDLFQFVLTRIDMNPDRVGKSFTESKHEYFFNKQQLKQFVEHINEATRDHV